MSMTLRTWQSNMHIYMVEQTCPKLDLRCMFENVDGQKCMMSLRELTYFSFIITSGV